jgi:hypothetical protein
MAAARHFNLIHGVTYLGIISLSFLESLSSNEYIAKMFQDGGFIDVTISGNGETRYAKGTWNEESRIVALDQHIISVSYEK